MNISEDTPALKSSASSGDITESTEAEGSAVLAPPEVKKREPLNSTASSRGRPTRAVNRKQQKDTIKSLLCGLRKPVYE